MLNQIRSLLHLNSLGADYVFNSRAEICTNMVYTHDIENMIASADIEQYLQQEMEFRIERYLFLHYLMTEDLTTIHESLIVHDYPIQYRFHTLTWQEKAVLISFFSYGLNLTPYKKTKTQLKHLIDIYKVLKLTQI